MGDYHTTAMISDSGREQGQHCYHWCRGRGDKRGDAMITTTTTTTTTTTVEEEEEEEEEDDDDASPQFLVRMGAGVVIVIIFP
jgi:hypothetical protein